VRVGLAFILWSVSVVAVASWLERQVPPSGPCDDVLTPGIAPSCVVDPGSAWMHGWTYVAAVAGIWGCGVLLGYFVLRRRAVAV
jgi:hypothetical protein